MLWDHSLWGHSSHHQWDQSLEQGAGRAATAGKVPALLLCCLGHQGRSCSPPQGEDAVLGWQGELLPLVIRVLLHCGCLQPKSLWGRFLLDFCRAASKMECQPISKVHWHFCNSDKQHIGFAASSLWPYFTAMQPELTVPWVKCESKRWFHVWKSIAVKLAVWFWPFVVMMIWVR